MQLTPNTSNPLSEQRIIFVINDYYSHGGHVKSFLSQFTVLREQVFSFHIICAVDGYFFLNRQKHDLSESEVTAVDMSMLRRWYFGYSLYNAIKAKLTNNTILHVFYGDCYFSCLLAKSHFQNVTLLCSIMGGPNPFPRLPSSDCYIAVSPEQLIQTGASDTSLLKRGRTAVIKNRLSVTSHLKNVMQHGELKRGILIVTRFDHDKAESLELITKIVTALPENITIKFAGTGQLLNHFKQRFLAKKNVVFLGFCQDFSQYYQNTAVVLGMGRSVLEFMINGMPAVLIGFVGAQLLDDLESVVFASERNFAGRTITGALPFPDLLQYIIHRTNFFTPLNDEVVDFLRREYDVEFFTQRYAEMIDKSRPSNIGKVQFVIEYLYIFLRRATMHVIRNLRTLVQRVI